MTTFLFLGGLSHDAASALRRVGEVLSSALPEVLGPVPEIRELPELDGGLILLRSEKASARLDVHIEEDLVAVLPDTPACRSLLAARSGILEFRPEGPDPLVLEDRTGRCPIRGLALPLSLE